MQEMWGNIRDNDKRGLSEDRRDPGIPMPRCDPWKGALVAEDLGMIIALDRKSQDCVDHGCLQLRTPLTQYAREEGVWWVMDNGSFSNFDVQKFTRMAGAGFGDPWCKWIALPDEVGDHEKTLEYFHYWQDYFSRQWIPTRDRITSKSAFVLQDGATIETIPWDKITAVFLGGSTRFKLSRRAYEILDHARDLGKWVHVGRVNTTSRIVHFHGIADSIDGSGIARFDEMLRSALATIRELDQRPQSKLEEWT